MSFCLHLIQPEVAIKKNHHRLDKYLVNIFITTTTSTSNNNLVDKHLQNLHSNASDQIVLLLKVLSLSYCLFVIIEFGLHYYKLNFKKIDISYKALNRNLKLK